MPLMGFVAVAEAGAKLEFKINAFKINGWNMIHFLPGQKTYFSVAFAVSFRKCIISRYDWVAESPINNNQSG